MLATAMTLARPPAMSPSGILDGGKGGTVLGSLSGSHRARRGCWGVVVGREVDR
jgi:hypothetical protein